jgi:hypothetical protein
MMAIIYFMHAPNFGIAMQYANPVPERRKHAKASLFSYGERRWRCAEAICAYYLIRHFLMPNI